MNVGDYVRTKDGLITKIINIDNTIQYSEIILKTDTNDIIWCSYEEDLKSSPQIIDLIEKGDYVNGSEVMDADWFNENGEYEEGLAFPLYSEEDLHVIVNWLPLKYVEIHSIVTHEQMEAMQYRVEE